MQNSWDMHIEKAIGVVEGDFMYLKILCLIAFLMPTAFAKIYWIELKEGQQKKHEALLVDGLPTKGKKSLLGEIVSGLIEEDGNFQITESKIVFNALIPTRPTGQKIVSIRPDQIQDVGVRNSSESLKSLFSSYNELTQKLRIKDQAKACKAIKAKDDLERWVKCVQVLISKQTQLMLWLQNNSYSLVAQKMAKDIEKSRKKFTKKLKKLGSENSDEFAIKVTQGALEGELARKLKSLPVDYQVFESKHIRLYLPTRVHSEDYLSEELGVPLVKLAEVAIQSFKWQYVFPYPELTNHIPEEGVFQEYFFVPSDPQLAASVARIVTPDNPNPFHQGKTNGYGSWIGDHRINVWSVDQTHDLEGAVADGIGRTLANYHYNEGRVEKFPQPWIEEAVAYDLAFDLLSRISVLSIEFGKTLYDVNSKDQSDDELLEGFKKESHKLGLKNGLMFDAITNLPRIEMGQGDIAKAWSFYDFIKGKGLKGHQLLRSACSIRVSAEDWDRKTLKEDENGRPYRVLATPIDGNKWRETLAELFEIQPGLIFSQLEKEWRKHAEGRL